MTTTATRTTQTRVTDMIVITDAAHGHELARLFDGQSDFIIDTFLNTGVELFGAERPIYDVRAILAAHGLTVEMVRAIDAAPVPDLT